MSEINTTVENQNPAFGSKVSDIFETMNSFIDKMLSFFTDHPWADWINPQAQNSKHFVFGLKIFV